MRGNLVAWTSYMRSEDFRGLSGQPLIDERDFRTLHVTNFDSGKVITLTNDQFMLSLVRVTGDRRIYARLPREVTASPDRITDVVRF